MQKSFKFSVTIVAVGILVAGVLASMNFGMSGMSAEAQATIHSNQTFNGKIMASNTTANMTKENSTSIPTPEGPPPP